MQSLQIHQFNAQYTVASTSPNSAAVQRRLDHVAMNLLSNALETQLENSSEDEELICFVEQMATALTIDLAKLDDRQIATTWAKTLQQGIAKTLNQGGNGVIVFRNRGEFLAGFLSDLMVGQAWNCWYYQEFWELRSLSSSQAILSVLTADSDSGREALLMLTQQGQLNHLLVILSDAEVDAIAQTCLLPPSPSVVLPNTIPVWIEAVRSRLQHLTLTGILARDLTRLYLELLRHQPTLGPDVHLARFIRDLLQLHQTVMARSDRLQLLQLLAADQWTGVLNLLERGAARQLLMTLMPEVASETVVQLLQDLQIAVPLTTEQLGVTPYGGVFLLVSAIAELELDRFLQHCPYPEPEGMSKTGLLLWLIALQCLGYENAVQAKSDRALALFAGLSHPPTAAQLQNYAETLTPAMHSTFTEQFQIHLREQLNRPDQFGLARVFSSVKPMSLDWFSLCSESNSILQDAEWNGTLIAVSATVLQAFVAKLGTFADSSPAYLCRNFLESQAVIEPASHQITVRFLTCPLQMVLRMAGFDHQAWKVSWLEDRQLTFQFD